jgi:hypothetical protein
MTTVPLCPTPPSDFHDRPLSIRELNLSVTDLYRIHRQEYGPIFYTRKSNGVQYRFDAANNEFGVLYVALAIEGAFMETVIRDRFAYGALPLLVDEKDLLSRSVSRLGWTETRTLRLADFTAPLVSLGGDSLILSTPDYMISNQWSSAVFAHPARVDGILYRSRYAAQDCIAVFDRALLAVRDKPLPLLQHPDLPRILDRYGIGIAPPADAGWCI